MPSPEDLSSADGKMEGIPKGEGEKDKKANNSEVDGQSSVPPLSKNQLKKRRRWERAMEVKRRRKQQELHCVGWKI